MNDFPVDFQTVAKGGDQLKPISSSDLMRNFANRVLASTGGALSWKEDIPEAPASGTYVLGAVEGALTWIATEEC